MPEWDFAGPVPTVQPGDIRNALGVQQHRRESGQKGIFGNPRVRAGCDPSPEISAVITRTTILLIALDQGVLAKWREGDALRDIVFQVIATYPITCRDDRSLDFDMNSFITTLEASG
jgi:hypothetical protein